MYPHLLFAHSIFRWLALFSLVYAIYRGVKGWTAKKAFTKLDDRARHITATVSHIQLLIGYVLYFNSPTVRYFRDHYNEAVKQSEYVFFGLIHILMMTLSIILITVGSAIAKRQDTGSAKFKAMACFYAVPLVIILLAIPWPFSPLANRPYLRTF